MVKIKFIFTSLLFFISIIFLAQENEAFVRKGLLKATATISPSFMLNRNINNIYVSGELECFLENKVSVRGDCFWYRDSQQDIPFLKEKQYI